MKTMNHTTGAKSFARKRADYVSVVQVEELLIIFN